MLLNRYVDLTEAIDAQDASFLDHGDFHDTDAVPLQVSLSPSLSGSLTLDTSILVYWCSVSCFMWSGALERQL